MIIKHENRKEYVCVYVRERAVVGDNIYFNTAVA